MNTKTKKNIDIKQGLISTLPALAIYPNCKKTQFIRLRKTKQVTHCTKYPLYPQNVDKSKIQIRLTWYKFLPESILQPVPVSASQAVQQELISPAYLPLLEFFSYWEESGERRSKLGLIRF
ncbi:MAG: hypothetical protein ACTIJQ_09070 [Alcaligenes sp.]